MTSPKYAAVQDLMVIREEHRRDGKIVVQCHGCFDIVHPGHIRYLKFAREQGDVLIVSVSGDDVVAKGFDRPFINEKLRVENLAALEFVDHVCLDNSTWAGPILDQLKPDVYVKGKEYETNADPRFLKERQLVEDYGGKVIFSSGDVVYSSTDLIDRFRHRMPLERDKIEFFCAQHAVSRVVLEQLINTFSERRVLVVGDASLDRYISCEALGLASEEPILSVAPVREEWHVSDAGLVACQMSLLGASVQLLTAFHDDEHNDRFCDTVGRCGVELDLVENDRRPVYLRTFYLVEDTKVFKITTGRYTPLSSVTIKGIITRLEARLPTCEALVVTDSGNGLFGPELLASIASLCRDRGVPYFVDVSHTGQANVLKFEHPRLATPTEDELRFALGDKESGLSNLAARYVRETGAEKLILTLGKRGAILFTPPGDGTGRLRTDYLPAFTQHAVDAVGAGDVFLAALVLAEASRVPTPHGLYLGSLLASMHVRSIGSEPTRLVDLKTRIDESTILS